MTIVVTSFHDINLRRKSSFEMNANEAGTTTIGHFQEKGWKISKVMSTFCIIDFRFVSVMFSYRIAHILFKHT